MLIFCSATTVTCISALVSKNMIGRIWITPFGSYSAFCCPADSATGFARLATSDARRASTRFLKSFWKAGDCRAAPVNVYVGGCGLTCGESTTLGGTYCPVADSTVLAVAVPSKSSNRLSGADDAEVGPLSGSQTLNVSFPILYDEV